MSLVGQNYVISSANDLLAVGSVWQTIAFFVKRVIITITWRECALIVTNGVPRTYGAIVRPQEIQQAGQEENRAPSTAGWFGALLGLVIMPVCCWLWCTSCAFHSDGEGVVAMECNLVIAIRNAIRNFSPFRHA